tara:strand:- start:3454 stop:3840 length:387 start_codon:yes stop_codon:yes gene_type:complete
MAIPYNSTTNLPQGFETITIGSGATAIAYIVDACSGASQANRVINRTDADGDRADFMIREGSDQVEVTYTLQRAKTSTILPQVGFGFSHDYDRSGTGSSMVVKDVTVNRDKDSFDTFEMTAIRKTYQG